MRIKWANVIASGLALIALAGCQQEAGGRPVQSTSAEIPVEPTPQAAKPSAYEGPFGLKMGLTPSDAKALIPSLSETEETRTIFEANSVPIPHPDFESYTVVFSQKTGLCKVTAIGKDITSGDAGFEVRSAFDSLDEALTKKYGKGKKYDISNDRYDSPEYWMMYLKNKNRTLAKAWGEEHGSALTSNLNSIVLQAHATTMSTGYLVVHYEFENMADCVAEAKAEINRGL
jgi:hypothetical protein